MNLMIPPAEEHDVTPSSPPAESATETTPSSQPPASSGKVWASRHVFSPHQMRVDVIKKNCRNKEAISHVLADSVLKTATWDCIEQLWLHSSL